MMNDELICTHVPPVEAACLLPPNYFAQWAMIFKFPNQKEREAAGMLPLQTRTCTGSMPAASSIDNPSPIPKKTLLFGSASVLHLNDC
ncbi:hypothetical protein M2480_000752 [Parabacteroides sp. PFB2-12]|nr:hypothetical protein [Parabacteroides sp. PM6-13]MDH6389786.1 hypothetical protein [Parabacteroides sp. PFB2-12]